MRFKALLHYGCIHLSLHDFINSWKPHMWKAISHSWSISQTACAILGKSTRVIENEQAELEQTTIVLLTKILHADHELKEMQMYLKISLLAVHLVWPLELIPLQPWKILTCKVVMWCPGANLERSWVCLNWKHKHHQNK